ncbi:MAG: PEP-CTERM sorting domain-containing protein, partial [Planctomycetia bacterium]
AVNPNTRAAPSFFIPTENEWYKAAYFTPDKNGAAGYYVYATRQDTTPPGNNPTVAGPTANYLVGPIYCITQSNVFSPTQHYLTDVGMFSASGSHYGTFDQNGLVYQWNDLDGKRAAFRGLRGGFWAGGAITLQKSTFTQVTVGRAANDTGIRLAAPLPAPPASR